MKITISCDYPDQEGAPVRVDVDAEGQGVSKMDIINTLMSVIEGVASGKGKESKGDIEGILSNIGGFDGLKN